MNRFARSSLQLLLLACLPVAAEGQRSSPHGVTASLNAAFYRLWIPGETRGVTGSLGLGFGWRGVVLSLLPIDVGVIQTANNDLFRLGKEEGGWRCRSRQTLEVVDKANCENQFTLGSVAELHYVFGGAVPVMVGGGYRHGDFATAFGTIAVAFTPLDETHVLLHVRGGRDFAQVGLGVGWPLY